MDAPAPAPARSPRFDWKTGAAPFWSGVVVVLLVILVAAAARWSGVFGRREGFVSPRAQEVYNRSTALFTTKADGVSYADFRGAVPGADPVTYSDVRGLWRRGALTPEAVQKTL